MSFGRWLATPIREARRLFPFSHEGRQTLIYLIFAGAGPAMTAVALHILETTEGERWDIYAEMARTLGWALLIIVAALGCFVSIRAVKVGRDGLEVDAHCKEDDE